VRSRPVQHPDLLDFRATIVIAAAAAVLTIRTMQGADLAFLALDYRAWPQEPWRLLTTCLLHANLLHLVFNLMWMWQLGSALEAIFGLRAMIGVYLLLALVSSAAQWGLAGAGIGLSGVVYGLFGLTWALDRYHPSYGGILDPRTTQLFIVWFFLCIVFTVTDVLPIGNEAHGAGAICGGLLGLALSPWPRRRRSGRLGLAAFVLASIAVATVARPYVTYSDARPWELFYDGTQALIADEYESAARSLESAVERDPDMGPAWYNLSLAYRALGRPQDAVHAAQRAADLGTRAPDGGFAEER
jgi:membrane associated rhomboid family serine protease